MNEIPQSEISRWILSSRGSKNPVDPQKPYAWLTEKERTASGEVEDVGVIFLTNRECPFQCLMCDLWKNTTDLTVPEGAIPAQIEFALNRMPSVNHLKIYNSGSFFDIRAIPLRDYKKIAALLESFETVIVECHPLLIDKKCLVFQDMLKPDLQIALGLETIHPEILQKLNKQMTTVDFADSVSFLTSNGIRSRAFVLLRTPYMSEKEGVYWAERSIDFAFTAGVGSCTVIPVRPGNGATDTLLNTGSFSLPAIRSLEKVLEYGISLKTGRVFADVWDLKIFSRCDKCLENRISRLIEMNLTQRIPEGVKCSCDLL